MCCEPNLKYQIEWRGKNKQPEAPKEAGSGRPHRHTSPFSTPIAALLSAPRGTRSQREAALGFLLVRGEGKLPLQQ